MSESTGAKVNPVIILGLLLFVLPVINNIFIKIQFIKDWSAWFNGIAILLIIIGSVMAVFNN